MRWLTTMVLVAGLGLVCGCRSSPSASFEAFSRNKLAVLARNVESTREAQQAATDQIDTTVKTIKEQAWTGADPADAYDLARRAESSCESRVRAAHNRIRTVQATGEDMFRQWSKEISEYEDPDLKESSRQNRLKVKASFDGVIEQMKKADAATEPALVALRDQVLFLKHHRNSATVPARPEHSADPGIPAEALARLTTLAAARAKEFAESVRAAPKEAPQESPK